MRISSIARRYAEATFDVGGQGGNIQSWINDLRAVANSLEDRRVMQYFRDPNISRGERLQTLEKLFPRIQPGILNLLRILVMRQRLHLVPPILSELESLQREAMGMLEADVTVARSIEDEERLAIERRLGEMTGKKVEVRARVDPGILGGIIVRLGDRLIDASVQGRLQRLRQELVT